MVMVVCDAVFSDLAREREKDRERNGARSLSMGWFRSFLSDSHLGLLIP